ncbi:MAG: 23S rRNA (pseudouridine(1915)-N(3))-methyltransferase RlmH, partial [Bacteroidales bacterium]|nr:23S rRNA (pseudouridine(1915)-N(3))-methyltransferase RlmH [Bacteroidales bacterium]
MKIQIILVGKTEKQYLISAIAEYENRLTHYTSIVSKVLPAIKKTKHLSEQQQKTKEGEQILSNIKNDDTLILLDENGKEFSSVGFSGFIEKKMIAGTKNLIFVVGGPYGFS